MNAQQITMAKLEKSGFKFSNWIQDNTPGAYGNEPEPAALMRRKGKHGNEYREVDSNGNIK